MAAHGALVSLTHILDQILNPPPSHRFIIPREQIESLRKKVYFLIDFLETYSRRSSREIEDLEAKIADAAYAAADIIESDVVSQIRGKYARCSKEIEAEDIIESNFIDQIIEIDVEKICALLCEGIRRVLEKLLSIEKPKSSTTGISSRPLPSGKITLVGLDKHLIRIMTDLTTDESSRQIVPIVGMGGIGKSTLATAVYNNPFIVERFHVRAWITVSQEYTVRELLLHLLHQINKASANKRECTDDELGLQLQKELSDRKYLIVMDDMWNIRAYKKLIMFLPDNGNGSRILVTTRLSNLTIDFESCTPYKMDFLDEG